MKFVRRAKAIEVKRAFVTAQKMRLSRKKGKKYLPKLELREFRKKLAVAKRAVSRFSEKQLDRFIGKEWKSRERAYNRADWYVVTVFPNEVGVWRRAGGLPSSWTCYNLAETARYVGRGLKINSKRIRARSKRSIPRIAEFSDIISKENALLPIVFKSGTGTKGRKWCRKILKGDIDDGCMRAIALTIKGAKRLRVYFGIPKKTAK